jgi:hypothetical protein
MSAAEALSAARAAAVRAYMAARTVWTETAASLLGALTDSAGKRAAKSKSWPDSPRALSGRLRRAAPFLRKIEIEVAFGREDSRARSRAITVTSADWVGNFASKSSEPSATATDPKSRPVNDLSDDLLRTDADGRERYADGRGGNGADTVRTNSLVPNGLDGVDGLDTKIPTQSDPQKPGSSNWRGQI